MTEFEIVNVVGTIDFQESIDLDPLANDLANRDEISKVKYDPSALSLIHSWLSKNGIYVAFYKNGTCSVTGASSLAEFNQSSETVNKMIKDVLDFRINPIVEVKNVVATAEMTQIPPLENIAIGLGLERTEYEPEQFPALIYRRENAVFLIFSNGSIICNGLVDIEEISSAISHVKTQIKSSTVS